MRSVQSIDETVHWLYTSLSKPFKTAFAAAVFWGMAAHLYMFMNKLPNYDDMGINGFGATFRLGRWFLWFLAAVAYHLDFVYSLPWVNGLTTLLFIALSAGLTADVLDVKSTVGNIMIGAAMAVYPSLTATFFFMFTAPYYAIALFLSACAVWVTVKRKGKFWFAASSLLLACSMGIYQAYIPFAASIYVIAVMMMTVEPANNCRKLIKYAVCYFSQLLSSGILYIIITQFSLIVTKQKLTQYRGAGTIQEGFIRRIFRDFFGIVCNNDLELSYNAVTRWMYLFLFLLSGLLIVLFICHFFKEQQYLKSVGFAVLAVAFVISVNSICIIIQEVYSLMRYAYVCLLILPICLVACYKQYVVSQRGMKCALWVEWSAMLVLAAGILSYCHFANAQYLSLYLGYEQASGYYGTVITQIKMLEGYEPGMKTALIGSDQIEDQSLYRNQVMEVFEMSGRDSVLAQAYSIEYFIRYYCGFDTEFVEADLTNREIVQMPVYPAAGSIKIVEDVVVVKFAE